MRRELSRDKVGIENDAASGRPIAARNPVKAQDMLPGADKPLDDPIDRPAIQYLGLAPGHVAGHVAQLFHAPFALCLGDPLLLNAREVGNVLYPNGHFSQMQRHMGIMPVAGRGFQAGSGLFLLGGEVVQIVDDLAPHLAAVTLDPVPQHDLHRLDVRGNGLQIPGAQRLEVLDIAAQ